MNTELFRTSFELYQYSGDIFRIEDHGIERIDLFIIHFVFGLVDKVHHLVVEEPVPGAQRKFGWDGVHDGIFLPGGLRKGKQAHLLQVPAWHPWRLPL